MGIAGALIIVLLAGFSLNEYWIKPRHVMATVDGTKIRRKDYWKVRSYDLLNQASQFQQLAQFSDAEQQSQYQQLAQQALIELDDVWGSTDTNDTTLQKMVDDQVYLKNIGELGLSVTDQDVDTYIDQQFEPANAPIFTPTPSPTLIPTRAAWATETAIAQDATATANAAALEATPESVGSPEADGSPEAAGSPEASTPQAAGSPSTESMPEAEAPVASPASPGASPDASPVASPEASPEASPVAEATVSPTPNQEQALQTAEAGYDLFQENAFDATHMSEADYERLIVRPAVARQKVREAIEADVGQSAEQVHASHILVSTKDLADSLFQQVQQPEANFEQIAKDNSTDTSTAPNGGDLGWFPRGIMVGEFDAVAFATPPGQISQPFQSEFGWHIVKVYALEPDRPMTDDQISQVKSSRVEKWLEDQKADSDIESEVDPTPTPADRTFEPPPDAPPTPTPTPTEIATPEGSPAASPESSTVASPVAQ